MTKREHAPSAFVKEFNSFFNPTPPKIDPYKGMFFGDLRNRLATHLANVATPVARKKKNYNLIGVV